MQRRTLLLTGLAIGPWASGWALASNAASPHSMPPEVLSVLPHAQAVGQTKLRYWGFDVYDARLWVTPSFRANTFAQHPLALELTYHRGLKGSAIAQRSLEEMRRAEGIAPAIEQRWLTAMQALFPDVRAGDRLTGIHQPGVGARFWLNGQLRGEVADAEFSRLFFGIWLSDSTSEPRLRAELLTQAAR